MADRITNYELWQAAEEFRDVMLPASELCYMGDGGLAPATRPQRGYIHGLCYKTGYDEEDLPYHIKSLYDLTIVEASEVIEILKSMVVEEHSYRKRYDDLF